MTERIDCKPTEAKHLKFEIKIEEDRRGIIAGTVVDKKGCPVKDAVVVLYELCGDKRFAENCKLVPVTYAFTDKNGEFAFGPTCPDEHYVIKVWKNPTDFKFEKAETKHDRECLKVRCDKMYPPKDDCKNPHHPKYDPEFFAD